MARQEVGFIRQDTIEPARAAFKTHGDEVADIEADLMYKKIDQQRHWDLKREADAKRDAEIQRVSDGVAGHCASILQKYPERRLPPPSADLTAQAGLIFPRFGLATGKNFFQEAAAVLDRASAPDMSLVEALKENQLLESTYLPLCLRCAEQPERHCRALQPAYQVLAGLIQEHLDTFLGNVRHSLAATYTEETISDFKWITGHAEQSGAWDDTLLSVAAKAFDFGTGR